MHKNRTDLKKVHLFRNEPLKKKVHGKFFFCQEITLFLLLGIVESVIAVIWLLLIPSDIKNAFLFGYSKKRILMVSVVFFLFILQIFLIMKKANTVNLLKKIASEKNALIFTKILGIIGLIAFWFTVWFDAKSLGRFSTAYIRIKPLLLLIEIQLSQTYFFIKTYLKEFNFLHFSLQIRKEKKVFLLSFVIGIGLTLIAYFLHVTSNLSQQSGLLFFSPSAPISSSQIFVVFLFLLVALSLVNEFKVVFFRKDAWIVATFLFITIITYLVWRQTPFVCTDDRPGPFDPNLQCYPAINDAVYSIGSHYAALGEGIYNHWLTDKPLYMLFLAIGQKLLGLRIDQYLLFQIAILALIPSCLFLIGKRYVGYVGGGIIAILEIILGRNEIYLYQEVGGVNAKLENTELLTALGLVFLCIALYKWFENNGNNLWAVISGGVLGFTSLIRFTPIFIFPMIVLFLIFKNFKIKRFPSMELGLFTAAFIITFFPTVFFSKDVNGNNYYIEKIENVISQRFSFKNEENEIQNTPVINNSDTTVQLSPNGNFSELYYPPEMLSSSSPKNAITHFANNVYSGLAIFPSNPSFGFIKTQIDQNIWTQTNEPIWQKNLSIENLLLLSINIFFIVLGIILAIKKTGFCGLIPLCIFLGYHLGNATSMSSGGRYLQPVNWVTLIYYSGGIICFARILVNFFHYQEKSINN